MKLGVILLLLIFSPVLVHGQDEKSPAEKYFTDVELIDQDGRKLRFYTDVLKGKVIAINTFFTTCTKGSLPVGIT